MTSKKDLSEQEIRTKYIAPAIEKAGWDRMTQLGEDVPLTDGKIFIRGKLYARGKLKRADYVLYFKPNIPIAIIEAKDNNHSVRSGIQQALGYRELLKDVPCVYSSNGDAFFEHDFTSSNGKIERQIPLDAFPTPEELWNRYKKLNNIEEEQEIAVAEQEYFYDSSGKKPRYYQQVAINRIVEAIAKGENRILLVLATGTGKTYVAFQAIYRLWKSGMKKRILYLADRNALINQTVTGDFKHFGEAMTVVRKKKIDKSFEIYLALYQGLTGYDEDKDAFREFSRDFFDLIIIDECHRGSAAADSAWRDILDYFNTATHIGLTATPRETSKISNIDYFGEPIYTYTLKQGIDDGFLAPYQVLRVGINVDLEGWRPEDGKTDKSGKLVTDREYNTKDYDRNLVIDERTQIVAWKLSEYLKKNDRFAKTIIFCVDIDHAERMAEALRNENQDLVAKNPKYVMQITGDNDEGKRELHPFQNEESRYPVLVTTSKLLTTGIDAPTCRLIVLDSNIGSMTEFKQIIGRGTRLSPEFDKYYFTIVDFRENARKFSDPGFDGPPIQDTGFGPGDDIDVPPPDNTDEPVDDPDTKPDPDDFKGAETDPGNVIGGGEIVEVANRKIYVDGVEVRILNERIQYYGNDGKLKNQSLEEYTKHNVLVKYKSLNAFLNRWQKSDKKKAIIDELQDQGILLYELQEKVGKEMDPFDLICHIAFEMPPLTRRERADNVKKRNYFAKYGDNARKVIEKLLEKYADEGVENIESLQVLKLDPLTDFGSPREIYSYFGNKQQYLDAIKELETEIYKTA